MEPWKLLATLLVAGLLAGCLDFGAGNLSPEESDGDTAAQGDENDDDGSNTSTGSGGDQSYTSNSDYQGAINLTNETYAYRGEKLVLQGELRLDEAPDGHVSIETDAPVDWEANATVTNQTNATVPFEVTIQVPSDADGDAPHAVRLSAYLDNATLLSTHQTLIHVTSAYELANFKEWNRQHLDILIIPPTHGPLANTPAGPLPNGADGALPHGAYIDATRHALEDWRYAIDRVAENDTRLAWFADVTWDVRVVGEDDVTPTDITQANIIKVYTATTYPVLGAATHNGGSSDCIAYSTQWNTYGSMTYTDMYALAGHELLHCFGMNHPEDMDPIEDIMSYESWPIPELRCPSNLNVWASAAAFASAFRHHSLQGETVKVAKPNYEQYCSPDLEVP